MRQIRRGYSKTSRPIVVSTKGIVINDAASPMSSSLEPHSIASTVLSSLKTLFFSRALTRSLHILEQAVRCSALCNPPKPIHATALSALTMFHLYQHNAVSAAKLLRLSRTALQVMKSKYVEIAIMCII